MYLTQCRSQEGAFVLIGFSVMTIRLLHMFC